MKEKLLTNNKINVEMKDNGLLFDCVCFMNVSFDDFVNILDEWEEY